ncbi:Na+/H+ antiporter subunit B [Albibacterium profundi]|uniref:Na+/H+ antiporter subunit B n=1 Tax=Albibacterium profundi TaxID=3134906 RepID=A0ABV5CC35_9SPHI
MKILLLRTASNYLLPLLLLFSVFILLRGHYEPGGGFVGGLIASIAFILHSLAHGLNNTKKILRRPPFYLIPFGLAMAMLSGLLPLFFGQPFMTGLWMENALPIIGLVGTALFFDIGVYIVVIGVTLTILFTISESI